MVTEVETEVTTRTCFVCHVEKPLEEFRKNRSKPLGHEYMCKICRRAYEHEFNLSPERIAKVAEYRQGEEAMELNRERAKRNYASRPEVTRARAQIARLIKLGLIERLPCQVCGKAKTDGHHPNYNEPLQVYWLCRSHHWLAERIINGSGETMPALFIHSYEDVPVAAS